VRVTVFVADDPTGTVPKATLLALSDNAAASAVPLRLIVAAPLAVLVLNVRSPVFAPGVSGWKAMASATFCQGFSVSGKLAPEILKAPPSRVALVMVSGAVPDEVSLTTFVVDESRVRPPKVTLVALSVSAGTPTAVPTRLIAAVPREVLVFRVSVPVFGPAACGSNLISRVALAP